MVERALAAPVFAVVLADSIIFLKKPLLFALGVPNPPRTPALSIGSLVQSALGVGMGMFSEAWLSW
jgi:integral membrane sensor domain MASE1